MFSVELQFYKGFYKHTMAIFLLYSRASIVFHFRFCLKWEEKLILKTLFLFSAFCFSQKKYEGGDDDDELIGGENVGKRIFIFFKKKSNFFFL